MKKVFKYIFLCLYLFGVFYTCYSSLENANVSSNTSLNVTQFLYNIISNILPNREIDFDTFHGFVRKAIGHFGVFGFIGLNAYFTYFLFLKKTKLAVSITLIANMFTAIISELLQLLSDGRACSIKDMLIDYSGSIVGFAVGLIISTLFIEKKAKIK